MHKLWVGCMQMQHGCDVLSDCDACMATQIVAPFVVVWFRCMKVCCQCRYVPLGLAKWFQQAGIKNVHEMGWWQEMQHPKSGIKLACLPAQVSMD